MVIEKDEIAETQKTKQNTHGFHGFPVKRDNKKEVSQYFARVEYCECKNQFWLDYKREWS